MKCVGPMAMTTRSEVHEPGITCISDSLQQRARVCVNVDQGPGDRIRVCSMRRQSLRSWLRMTRQKLIKSCLLQHKHSPASQPSPQEVVWSGGEPARMV